MSLTVLNMTVTNLDLNGSSNEPRHSCQKIKNKSGRKPALFEEIIGSAAHAM